MKLPLTARHSSVALSRHSGATRRCPRTVGPPRCGVPVRVQRTERIGRVFGLTAQRAVPTPAKRIATGAHRAQAGFTLAEVLAALLFMAIVIPVTIEGLHIANRAGEVGIRKAVAGRIAERILNELKVSGQLQNATQSGVVEEGITEYRWTVRAEQWAEDAMQLVTVQVTFPVQEQDYHVSVSTLVNSQL